MTNTPTRNYQNMIYRSKNKNKRMLHMKQLCSICGIECFKNALCMGMCNSCYGLKEVYENDKY